MKKRIISAILAVCLALTLLPGTAWAAEEEAPKSGPWGKNLTWAYDEGGKKMTISGSGMMEAYNASIDPDAAASFYQYKQELETLEIKAGVQSVAEDAFSGCEKLRYVTLPDGPDGIIEIGDGAFSGCQALTSIELPESVRFIGREAFRGAGLETIELPEGVLTVEEATFKNCGSLGSVILPGTLLKIGDDAFQGCTNFHEISIPEGVREIGDSAFDGCKSLVTVSLPQSITDIGFTVFRDCEKLTTVQFPVDPDTGRPKDNYLLWIGGYAFAGCKSLTGIELPEGLETLGYKTFANCSGLTSIALPESLKNIMRECFTGCEALTKIEFGGSERRWDRLRAAYGHNPDYPDNGIADNIVDDWDKVEIGYLSGGQCGEEIYWYYSEKTNVLHITVPYEEAGVAYIIQTPEDDSLENWKAALEQKPLIYIDRSTGIAEGTFEGGTIVHRYPEAEEGGYSAPSDLEVHWLKEEDPSGMDWDQLCTGGMEHRSGGVSCTAESCAQEELLAPFAPKEFEPLPHRPEVYSKTATCVKEGTALDIRCADCGEQLIEPVEVPTASHEMGSKTWETTQKATCVEVGIKTWTWKCTTDGCDYVETGDKEIPIDRTNHDYGGWVITKKPTATTPGEKERACLRDGCGDTQQKSISPTSDVTHIVTIDPAGGVSGSQSDLLYTDQEGNITALPAAPTRDGYTFVGWYADEAGGTKLEVGGALPADTDTIYAKWEKDGGQEPDPDKPEEFTITFNATGGSVSPSSAVTDADGKVTLPTPTRDGYTFDGWYTAESDGDRVTAATKFDKDTTLYAHWTQNSTDPADKTYTITFNATGGSVSPSSAVTDTDGKVTLPTPTRDGYTFDGWYTAAADGEKVTSSAEFKKDTTLYAHWTQNSTTPADKTYTITFNATDGSVSPSSAVTDADGKVTLPTPTRDGYTFNGWYTAESGGDRVTTSTQFDKDTTLYARWTQNSTTPADRYTVTFNASGGSVSPSSAATNADGTVTLPTPTRDGYTFDGWYTAVSGGDRVTTSTRFNGNATVYAHWSQSSDTPSAGYYQVYTPGITYGGVISASHVFAAPGALVTVTSSPWDTFTLNQLSAIRADTGQTLYLTGGYDNQYTFLMPDSDVQVIGSFTQTYTGATTPGYPGTGTSGGNSGHTGTSASGKPVNWYYRSGSIYHVTDGLVTAGTAFTRDMLISILYNMDSTSSGSPTSWATKNNIVPDVYQSGLWGPDKPISREQAAMILFCYARHKGYATYQTSNLTGYDDYDQLRSIAQPAMAWSQAIGLMTATSPRTLSPQTILTCGDANVILSRFASGVASAW